MTKDGKLKIGIIGTGGIAFAHVEAYLKRNDIEIVAGADLVPGKARAFLDGFKLTEARDYNSHTELLEKEKDLDAVSVCTYNRQHAVCAIAALKRGLNVLLEKPMTVTLEEALEIRKAEKESGKFVSVGFQPRFCPNMQLVKKVVKSGELGRIYYIQTGGGRRRGLPTTESFIMDETAGIGAVGDIGCYSLDMVLNAIDYPRPLTVSAYTSNLLGKDPTVYEWAHFFEVDDFSAAFIRLEGDIVVDYRIAWAMNMDTPGDTLIFGTKGGLRIPSTDCWNYGPGGDMTVYKTVGDRDIEYKVPLIGDDVDPWDGKIGSFIDAVRNNGTAPVPTSQIIYNQAIIDGIVKSAKLKREVKIPKIEL